MLKMASAAIAIAQASPVRAQETPAPSGEISVRTTAGDKRFAAGRPLAWRKASGSSADSVVLDPSRKFQDILGFGAALTDASCFVLNQLAAGEREELLHELLHPSKLGLSVFRICVGSSDYATKTYSFDEGEPDPDMKRFSIDHDRAYILPILKQARAVNPDLFLLASPWSPPGWMKPNGSMLGGSMRKHNFAPYAQYLVKFLQGYADAGVPVQAISVQNEVDTDQDGRMPACLWGQEYEIEFVARHLGPQLAANHIDTRIWILDHNYNLWGRVLDELDDPDVNRFVDGVAWHGYAGHPSAMARVHDAHPEKHTYWTEGGPDITDPHYQTDWSEWGATFADILQNWARSIIAWNIALDENGKPNIGPFECGGTVTIHSQTHRIVHSGQYWAFAHYSSAIQRGAKRIESSAVVPNVAHVAAINPDGGYAAVLTNKGADRTVLLRLGGMEAAAALPADSVTSLTWS
jgi:glucosylceramidase